MERYRRTAVRHTDKDEKPDFKTKLVRQTIVCATIFAVVSVIGLLKSDTAVGITDKIQSSISYTVDYEETVKEILSAINNFTRGNENAKPEKPVKTN